MNEQEFFKTMSELGTHAFGVGVVQAREDFIKEYPEYEQYQDMIQRYLLHDVLKTEIGMRLREFMVREPLHISELSVGSKVRYQPSHYRDDQWENGIVKEILSNMDGVRVVYYCDNNWDNFMDYTAAVTSVEDLKLGWR